MQQALNLHEGRFIRSTVACGIDAHSGFDGEWGMGNGAYVLNTSHSILDSFLVDPASSNMLVSKI